jgi:hypothetical protein
MVWSSSWAVFTSTVRSPPGSGVRENRIVSPIPSWSRMPMAGRGGHDPLAAHAGLGEPEMDGVVGAAGQLPVDGDEVLNRRHLGRQDDPVAPQADLLGAGGGEERGLDHRLAGDPAHVPRLGRGGVLVHEVGQELLVEGAPIGPDAHGLAVADRLLDDGPELPVLLFPKAYVAGVDAVLVQGLGAGRVVGQELVADIVEVAHEGHGDPEPVEPLADLRHGGCGLVPVHGDAHDLGSRPGERRHLGDGRVHIRRIRVGHGLDRHGSAPADQDGADPHAHGPVARGRTGGALGGSGLRGRGHKGHAAFQGGSSGAAAV